MPPEAKVPADEPAEQPVVAGRAGLPDWVWAPLMTVAILAALIVIGRATFVA
jgi:hypothetical protein